MQPLKIPFWPSIKKCWQADLDGYAQKIENLASPLICTKTHLLEIKYGVG